MVGFQIPLAVHVFQIQVQHSIFCKPKFPGFPIPLQKFPGFQNWDFFTMYVASPQTSFWVRLSRIHCGGEMNA